MKRKKLLETLAGLLGKQERKRRKHHDELEKLLKKLKDKEDQLEYRASIEKDKHKRKRLVKDLEIVRAQRAKGLKTLRGLMD